MRRCAKGSCYALAASPRFSLTLRNQPLDDGGMVLRLRSATVPPSHTFSYIRHRTGNNRYRWGCAQCRATGVGAVDEAVKPLRPPHIATCIYTLLHKQMILYDCIASTSPVTFPPLSLRKRTGSHAYGIISLKQRRHHRTIENSLRCYAALICTLLTRES